MIEPSGNVKGVFIGEDQLSNEYLVELGRITAYLSILEFAMIMEIARLISKDLTTTLCMLGGDQYDRILQVLNSTFHHVIESEELRREFHPMYAELDAINRDRNAELHAIWKIYPSEPSAERVRFSKKDRKHLGFDTKKVDIADLRALAKRMVSASNALNEFMDRATGKSWQEATNSGSESSS